jgi:preprotein translocase subunit SecG
LSLAEERVMGFWFNLLTFLFAASSVVLVLIILVQRPQGGGLAQAFGGAGGGATDTAFGGRTGDVLTYLTLGAFSIYLVIAITLNVMDNPSTEEPAEEPAAQMSDSGETPLQPTAAPATAVPVDVNATSAVDQPLVAPAAAPAQPAPAQPAPAQPAPAQPAPAQPAPAPAP